MLRSRSLLLAAVVAIVTSACAFNVSDPNGPRGERASSNGANLADVQVEGVSFSADAQEKVLKLVNHASVDVLDNQAKLDARAARNIVAARPIGTLQALAAVNRVGHGALQKLHDFADAHDDASIAALPAQCSAKGSAMPGPGALASDQRVPELGDDVSIIENARISLTDGIAQVEKEHGPVVEAKYEIGDDGNLSLSIYPVDALDKDAERNAFHEASGDPSVNPWSDGLDTFTAGDREHLTRSARDLTIRQLSAISPLDAALDVDGFVYWSIPTLQWGRAGYGVYAMNPFTCESTYTFADGLGSDDDNYWAPADLGSGPGAGATDARAVELGGDVTIVRQSKIAMVDALAQVEAANGPAIEAKFELGDDGKLSLSIYPLKDVSVDPEHADFAEASGDPTADTFAPGLEKFGDDDVEHLTRSSRDLTIVQTASLSLFDAVYAAQDAMPGGFVFWAIPTIRDTRSGYGVYVLASDDTVHYFFID